jgi:protein SCO1/2
MLSFLKHKFTRKDRLLAKWGLSHLIIALLAGGALAVGLVIWQSYQDSGRARSLKQEATETVDQPSRIPPNNARIGGPFTLTGQDGQQVTDKDFAGEYLLVYFGYTYCPDMCPTGLQSISRALDQLNGDADKVQPLFITVDPARDTPARLKEYDSAFHPKIIGLTGTPEQIVSAAREYQVYYEKGEGDQDYEVDHTSLIFLMNPAGNLVTTFDEEVDPKLIVAALQKAWGGQVQPGASSGP